MTKWNTALLGDLCEFRGGLWTGKKPPFTKVKVIRNTNFTKRHTLDLSDVAEIDVEERQLAKRTLSQDDIILEKSGGGPKQPVGRVVLFRENAAETYSFSNFTTAMRVRDKSKLSPIFLHWFLLHFYESGQTVGLQSNSTGLRNLNMDSYKEVEIPIPPMPEQNRIVSILDQSFDNISRATLIAKRNIANAGDFQASFRESQLARTDGDTCTCLVSEICEIRHGYAFESQYFVDQSDYTLLTPGNFYERGGYRDRGEKQKFYEGPIPDGFILSAGDLLLAMTEQAAGLLGSPAIVPADGTFLHNQRLGKVVPKDLAHWHTPFFFHLFNSSKVRSEVHRGATGVKVRHSSPTKIGSVQISFPRSLAVQQDIATQINSAVIEATKITDLQRRKISALESLSASLLSKAFSGGL